MIYLTRLTLFILLLSSCAEIELKSLKQDVQNAFKQNIITDQEIVSAFREALEQSTNQSVALLSSKNGFINDKDVAISFPEEAQKLEKTLRKLGFNSLCDDFYMSMNLAAEKAIPEAAPLFITAIQNITFIEATKLLKGNDTAITDFLKQKTSASLVSKFQPIVADYLEKNKVTKNWNKLISRYNKLPMVKPVQANLSYHVTQEAVEGLFFYISKEESSIRKNPQERTTALIKKVFSQAD